jgi:acetyl esterase
MHPAPKSIANRDDELLSRSESIAYKHLEDGSALKAHVFLPESEGETAEGRPALAFFFGSGFDSGRVTQFAPQALHFANRGAVSILFEYRTRSSHGASPIAAMQDARSAFRWVRFYADKLGIDPQKVLGVGALAGANIVAATAMKGDLPDEASDPPEVSGAPDAAVLFSPLIEVKKGGYGSQAFTESGTPLTAANLMAHISPKLPPMLIMHGTQDRLTPFDSVVKFVRNMQRKHNLCDLLPFEGRQHSFFNLNVDPAAYDHCNSVVDKFLVHLKYLPEAVPDEDAGESVRVIS